MLKVNVIKLFASLKISLISESREEVGGTYTCIDTNINISIYLILIKFFFRKKYFWVFKITQKFVFFFLVLKFKNYFFGREIKIKSLIFKIYCILKREDKGNCLVSKYVVIMVV